jgi:peptide chain release factor 1
MKESIKAKLQVASERFEELARLLSDASVISNVDLFKTYSKEYAQLEPISATYQAYQAQMQNIESLELMQTDADPELANLAKDELNSAKVKLEELIKKLEWHLIPKDPEDDRSVYLEIRAGAGGDEAAIFAGDLFRMYARYAESQGWLVETISMHDGDHGGFKEVIAHISGSGVYAELKFESGTHRVQRVPLTESQGRVHTSTCTVAVLPEFEEIDNIQINPED